jgi:DNA polymerase-3 subunit delta'
LSRDKLAGAYLFTGPEGIGKYLAARTFAQALNCRNAKDDACGACASCLKIEKNSHPDVHFIDALDAEAIGIEEVRQLKQDISLKSYEAGFKVFLINDAHKLTAEASNALLKILEEPPQDSVIILVTAKPQLLFKTIISRCQRIKFSSLPTVSLEAILKEDYCLDSALAHFLAYFCEGRLGHALRLKDADILKEKNRIINIFNLSSLAGLDSLAKESSRQDIRRYLNLLAGWFRDIYLAKSGIAHAQLINLDRRDELLRLIHRYSWPELENIFKCISDSMGYIEQNINTKLLLSNLKAELWKEKS